MGVVGAVCNNMRLEKYEKQFAEAKNMYHGIMAGNSDADILIRWMVKNEYNPFSIFHEYKYANAVSSLEGLIGVHHALDHAIDDDGDITFVKTRDNPVIIFYDRYLDNFQKYYDKFVEPHIKDICEITGYLKNVHEYIAEYDRCMEEDRIKTKELEDWIKSARN